MMVTIINQSKSKYYIIENFLLNINPFVIDLSGL